MFPAMRECCSWKRKRTWSKLSHVLILIIIGLSVTLAGQSKSQNGTESSEYYYYDEEEAGNDTNKGKNTSLSSDEYYYYVEEVIIRPKNWSSLSGLNVLRRNIPGGRGRIRKLKDSTKSESVPVGLHDIYGNDLDIPPVLPSQGPLLEQATQFNLIGPAYTDKNYGAYEVPGKYDGADIPLGAPIGPGSPFGEEVGELPPNPYEEEHGDTDFLRPRPAPPTEPPEDAGGPSFGKVRDVDYIDGIVLTGGEGDHPSFKDSDGHPQNKQPNKIKINSELTLNAFGWASAAKNPIVMAEHFFANLGAYWAALSTSEVIFWMEKFFNSVAEFSVPAKHYLRVISFAGIYLYGLRSFPYLHMDQRTWQRFSVQSRAKISPLGNGSTTQADDLYRLDKKFLDLFRGIDDDDDSDESFSDIGKSLSSEEDLADELDHISELCPKEAFYYSLNPRHIEAYSALKRLFLAQGSPAEVLALAKYLLYKEKVHPKVWYFAIVGAFLDRQDMTGFSVAHPLDAIPDWYIPGDLISDQLRKLRRSRRVKRSSVIHNHSRNTTFIRNKPYRYFYFKKNMKYVAKKGEMKQSLNSTTTPIYTKLPGKSGQDQTKTNYTVTVITSKNITVLNSNNTAKKQMTLTTTAATTTVAPSTIGTKVPTSVSTKQTPSPKAKSKTSTTTGTKKPSVATTFKPKLQQDVGAKGDKGELTQGSKLTHQFPVRGPGFLDDSHHQHHHHRHKHKKKKKGKKKACIKVDWRVGIDNGRENELWYWREDLMLNQHHWYWHQTHTVNSTQHGDRRAELFFYMHRAFIARYNAERLSNVLPRVAPLHFRPGGIIYEGYNSHLADVNSGMYWTPRWPQTPLQDVFHEHDPDFAQNVTLSGYLRNYRSLVKAIKSGKLLSQYGELVPINHLRGIEPLANTVEASDLSVNPQYYSPMGIHALGHILVGLSADPDFRFRRVTGVMSDAAVSMRDPSFYSYHSFMDNFFELYKQKLAPYKVVGGDFPLLWKGVEVVKISLHSQGGPPPNELRTFWTHHKFDLSPGVDRSVEKKEKTKICAQHLDHEPFHFKIVINRQPCVKSKSGKATVRIFMAPRYDEKGRRIPIKIQRRLFFALDSFTVKLNVGRNTITRYAEDSSLTQPWTKSIRDMERGPDPSGSADFCGCGWPQHLYIPKGHPTGMAFDLFVMVTNYDEDYVPNSPKFLEIPETCNSPYIFCGLPRRKYPDKRPMGYPFDRPLFKSFHCPPGWTFFSVVCKTINYFLHRPFDTLEEYVAKVPNMAMLKFHIRHLDAFFPEPARH